MKIKVGRSNGFCNTLFGWAAIYNVAEINNAGIVTDLSELNHITLPNTTFQNNFSGYIPFSTNDEAIANNGFKLKNGNYIATCGFDYNRKINWYDENVESSPIQKMKLKDNCLSEKIKKECKDLVGVHVRRGDYKNPTDEFVPNSCLAIPDYWYINLMSEVVKINKNARFYLSSDGTLDQLKPFYDKFDITNKTGIRQVKHSLKVGLDLNGFIDLFSLANCEMIIGSISTWTMVANIMKWAPVIWPESKDQDLSTLKQYLHTPKQKTVDLLDILKDKNENN